MLVNKFVNRRLPPNFSFSGLVVKSVQLCNGKFLVQGLIQSLGPISKFPFTLESGMSLKSGGHVLEVVSPNIHVDYGGYKISVPIPVEKKDGQIYGIDIGDNARLESFNLSEEGLAAEIKVLLSPKPEQPRMRGKPIVKGMPTNRALFSYDIGYILSSAIENVFMKQATSGSKLSDSLFSKLGMIWSFSSLWEAMIMWIVNFHLKKKQPSIKSW